MYDLETLGWDAALEQAFLPYGEAGLAAGRVALEHRGAYHVFAPQGDLLAEVRGRVRHHAQGREDFPAVGDWVAVAPYPNEARAAIHAILPRRGKFSRKVAGQNTEEQIVAANVDTVFLMQGLDHNYNPRRLERYLVMAWESGAMPVIILSKADLCDDLYDKLAEIEAIAFGVPIHALSSVTRQGLEALAPYLRVGRTCAFLGSSGVGKSTLINALLGREAQKTREVRASDSHGRHTTTHRELLILPGGGLLIDTPGMRELQLWDAGEGFADTFADIEELAARCFFGDCRHADEPACAVREALASDALDAGRYDNYCKMRRELDYLDARQDERLARGRKEQERRDHRIYRNIKSRRT